jgi:hypothetical protein
MKQKAREGQIVYFQDTPFRVERVSWVANPEFLGSRAKPGFFYQPVNRSSVEVNGWVNQHLISTKRRK